MVSTLHDEDIVFGDLSPHNVIVPDDVSQAQLIDFEGAIEVGGDDRARIATPGFVAPEQRAGHATKASDVYAIGAMGAALLFPVNAMCDMVPEARRRFMDAVVDDVGLPRGIVDLLQGLMAEEPDGRPRLAEVRQQLAEADWRVGRRVERRVEVPRLAELRDRALNFLEATWTPDRADRLVAADPRVFTTNPLSVAHGACGVARAFAYVTGKVPDVVVRYILAEAFDVAHYAPGLYIGLSGIAWTLLDLGERERAIHALRLAEHHQLRFSGHDVWHGEAGIGLAALRVHSVCGDGRALQMAIDSGEFLLKMARRESGSLNWAAGDVVPHGYAHGAAGVAEFLRQLGRATTDEMWLQAGVDALRFELHRAVTTRDEGWSWTYAADRPSAVLPYFEYGSAGVGAVAARFYSTTGLQEYRDALDRIRKDTARRFALQPGLAMGLSGLAEFLVDGFAVTGDPGWLSDLDKTLHGISLFAVEREEGVVFPGDRLQRLSCDYLTGNAGIAIALHRALTRGPRDLFL